MDGPQIVALAGSCVAILGGIATLNARSIRMTLQAEFGKFQGSVEEQLKSHGERLDAHGERLDKTADLVHGVKASVGNLEEWKRDRFGGSGGYPPFRDPSAR